MYTLTIGQFTITSDTDLTNENIAINTVICDDDCVHEIIDNFRNSYVIEKDVYTSASGQVVLDMLGTNSTPVLKDIYTKLFPGKKFERDTFVGNENNAKTTHLLRSQHLDHMSVYTVLGNELYRRFTEIEFDMDLHNEIMSDM